MKKQGANLILLVSLLFLGVAWMMMTNLGLVDSLFLPSPKDLTTAFVDLFTQRNFIGDIGISLYRVFSGFLLAFIIAVPLAISMSSISWLQRLLEPYIDFIRYLPVPALIPLSILFFGIGEGAKIALLFTGTFFQMILLILNDVRNIPSAYYDLAKTLGFSRLKIAQLKLQAIVPQLYDNARITLGWTWTYLVIAELVAAQSGIGHVIKEAQRFSDTPRVYIGILTLGVIGLCIDLLFKKFYPIIFPYKKYD
jgi:NitT/TauT family transport system permease protein